MNGAETIENPKVSIIVRTYDRANLLPEAIQSALDQTYQDFEIIVVDDGSTDDTAAVVRRFTDDRIRYVYQENRGIAGALNAGVKVAVGEYLGTLDSDDIWLPKLLEVAVSRLDADPRAGLFYAKASAIDSEGKSMPQVLGAPLKYPGQPLRSLLYGDPVAPCTVVVRTECFSKAGLCDEALPSSVDWDMRLRFARYYSFVYVDRVLALYRYHQTNFTGLRSNLELLTQARVEVLNRAFSDPDLPESALTMKPLAYRNVYMDVGMRWLGAGEWRKSLDTFSKAMRVSGRPLVTVVRILYLILLYRVFSRFHWTSHAISRLVHWRRRRSMSPSGERVEGY